MNTLHIRNFTRQSVPGLLLTRVAHVMLPKWEVSLVFAGEVRAKKLNTLMRGKTYVPNVLSYKVGKEHGEIIICPKVAIREAASFGLSPKLFIVFLFIHGLLHLKGYRHGTTMEKCQWKLLTQFTEKPTNTHDTKNSNRNRYRDVPSENGRHRRSD